MIIGGRAVQGSKIKLSDRLDIGDELCVQAQAYFLK